MRVALLILSTIIVFLARGYWIYLGNKLKQESRDKLFSFFPQIQQGLVDWQKFVNFDYYFNKRKLNQWLVQYQKISNQIDFDITKIDLNPDSIKLVNQYLDIIKNPEQIRITYNLQFVAQQKISHKTLFDELEEFPLDDQQRDSILHDEDNSLIIAGAGTGKTSTILGKVAYLLDKKIVNPNELLLIAFTKAAADEMAERIQKKLNANVKVKTFHGFGYEVIGHVEGAKPSLVFDGDDKQTKQFLNNVLHSFKKDENLMTKLTSFFAYELIPEKSDNMFKSLNEYYNYIKAFHLLALQGETVKSFEELKICNFLFLNGIKYKYEAKFQPEQKNPEYKVYKPDFYLPDYNIWLEHYGIDRDGNVPHFFNGKNGMSAKEVYNQGIEWKRGTHSEHNSNYIETYSYENREGILLSGLKEKLEKFGVVFNPISPDEIFKVLEKHKYIPFFIDLTYTFLSLVKSNHVTVDELKTKAQENNDDRALAFLDIFEVIFNAYQKYLNDNDEIDFNDMILKATNYIEAKRYLSNFKYIIIDEFQDMSLGRYKLIKELRDQNLNQKLYCVGDDWQSIYRFTGSDISITTKFEDYFGFTYEGKIETTYRFNDKILDFTSKFIQKNPFQLRKNLKSKRKESEIPFEISSLTKTKKEEIEVENSIVVEDLLKSINSKISIAERLRIRRELIKLNDDNLTQNEQIQMQEKFNNQKLMVFIIGRYNHSRPKNFFQLQKAFPFLKIEFYTAHRSKGKTCDYAILVDMVTGKYGFPTEIVDDPILNLVLHEGDPFENAEERRLFYVATTRARHRNYLVSHLFNKSKFIEEMEEEFNLGDEKENEVCESCTALMVKRSGQYGNFWACTNYPFCTQTKKIYENKNVV